MSFIAMQSVYISRLPKKPNICEFLGMATDLYMEGAIPQGGQDANGLMEFSNVTVYK